MNHTALPVDRLYKDRLFKMIFNDKIELLKLYNAINGTDYTDPAMLTITTLENAIYMTMENDLSFIIDMRLALYEQQSTVNPNLPLRFLMYVTDIYSSYAKDMNLYGTRPLQLHPSLSSTTGHENCLTEWNTAFQSFSILPQRNRHWS